MNNNYCIIMAGGKGRRLWPVSREIKPKQFIDLFGIGRTQLQQTFDRCLKIVPKENIYINTNILYLELVKEQLPEVSPDNIMAEPIYRNTAPSMAWLTLKILQVNKNACISIIPSDQVIYGEDIFKDDLNTAFDFVAKNACILTMGIRPTRPEPGYGYIQFGAKATEDVYQVKSFTEKPERDFARLFMESGEFYWNTGIFLFNARYSKELLTKLLPTIMLDFNEKDFPLYPNISIERGILERAEDVYVLKCGFGWADLGTWHSIYEAMQRGNDDNVVIDSDVLLDDSYRNIVRLPKGKMAVISGLSDCIIVEEDGVLFISPREDSSSRVRRIVNEVRMKRGDDLV